MSIKFDDNTSEDCELASQVLSSLREGSKRSFDILMKTHYILQSIVRCRESGSFENWKKVDFSKLDSYSGCDQCQLAMTVAQSVASTLT